MRSQSVGTTFPEADSKSTAIALRSEQRGLEFLGYIFWGSLKLADTLLDTPT